MDFPKTLTVEDMALRVKEWTLAGYEIECARRRRGTPARVAYDAEDQKNYSYLHIYYPERPISPGSTGKLSASYRHEGETWHYYVSRWQDGKKTTDGIP